MKNNKFLTYGIFSVMFVTLFFVVAPLFLFNPVIFFIDVSISLVVLFVVMILLRNYTNYKIKFAEDIKEYLASNYEELIDSIESSVALTLAKDPEKIIFYNEQFKKDFLDENYCFNDLISNYIPGQTVEGVILKENAKISYGDKSFNVSAKQIGKFIVFCFQNNTNYKNLKKKYIDSRLCAGFVVFDNKEEVRESSTDEQMSLIKVAVDNILSQWMRDINGISKKLSDGKYIIIFEEKYLKNFIDEKFKILNKFHAAKLDDRVYATVSMGISRGAENFLEAKNWAENALNMALGRGGDQVAIKNKSTYEFFGGASKGLEKRSKVRTRVVAMALLEKIKLSENVLIMGHKFSDFDVVGAAAGLFSVCSKIKKRKTFVIVNKNTSLAHSAISHLEKTISEDVFISPEEAEALMNENSLLIVVDTHSVKFLENTEIYNKIKNVVVIDHHRMSVDRIKNSVIFFHEPFASSTCEMVTELIQYMDDKSLKKAEAECLMAGIMLDTKNFSLKSGIRTFEAAAYLKKKGADNAEVKKMFASSIDAYKIRCKIIENAYVIDGFAVAKFNEESKNIRAYCSQAADELLNLKNVKASFVIFQCDDKINISSRSLGDVNVQVIMEKLGGGGHQTMAASQIENSTIEETEQKLIKIIKENTNGLEK